MLTPATILLLLLTHVAAADRDVIIGQNVLQFGRDKFPSYWRDVEEWSKDTGIFNGSKPENSDKDFGILDVPVVEEGDCGGCNCDFSTAFCGCVGSVRNCRVVMENTGGNIESCDTQSCTETVTYSQTQTVSNTFGGSTEANVFDKMKIGGKYEVTRSNSETFSDTKAVTLAKGETCTWISLKVHVECDVFNERHCVPIFIPDHKCTRANGCQRTTGWFGHYLEFYFG